MFTFYAPARSFDVGEIVDIAPSGVSVRILEADGERYSGEEIPGRVPTLAQQHQRIGAMLAEATEQARERVGNACLGSRP